MRPTRRCRSRADGTPGGVATRGGASRSSPPPRGRGRSRTGRRRLMPAMLSDDDVAAIDAYWRAANYLTVGQIYLRDNPLLREPLTPEHIKPRLLGHWGTSPGLS